MINTVLKRIYLIIMEIGFIAEIFMMPTDIVGTAVVCLFFLYANSILIKDLYDNNIAGKQ